MTIGLRTFRMAGALLVLLLCALPVHAQGRPSALEQRIDALSTQQLLTGPAASLVDPDRQVAAARYFNARIPGFLLVYLLAAVVLAWFWRSGMASAHRDRLRRTVRTEFTVRWLFGASLAVIAWLASLLPQFYLYRLDRVMETSHESWTAWALGWFLSAGVACIVVGTIAAIVLWLADKTHQWYLYTAVGVVVVTILYAYVAPAAIDPLRTALIEAAIIIISMAVAVAIADRIGFRRDDDPVSRLALVAALLGGVYLLALPVYLSYVRQTVAGADRAGTADASDRAAAVRALVRRADQNLEPVCPNTFAMLYFAQAPAIGSRIATIDGGPDPCR